MTNSKTEHANSEESNMINGSNGLAVDNMADADMIDSSNNGSALNNVGALRDT